MPQDNLKIDNYFIQSQKQRNLLTDLKSHIAEVGMCQPEYSKKSFSQVILQKQNIPIIQAQKLVKSQNNTKVQPEIQELKTLLIEQQSQISDLKKKNIELQNFVLQKSVVQSTLLTSSTNQLEDTTRLNIELKESLLRESKLKLEIQQLQSTLNSDPKKEFIEDSQKLQKQIEVDHIQLQQKYDELIAIYNPEKVQQLEALVSNQAREQQHKDSKIIKLKEKYTSLKVKYLELEQTAEQLQELLQTDQTTTQNLIKELFDDIQQLKQFQQQKFTHDK